MTHPEIPSDTKRELLTIPGVVSVGETTEDGRVVIVIGIEAPDALIDRDEIPDEILGHPTRIEVVGRFSPKIATALDPVARQTGRESRVRPLRPGVSTSNLDEFVGNGTLGWVMTDGNQWYLTSNNHVWTDNGVGLAGDRIIQPGELHGGGGSDVVGQIANWVQIQEGSTVDMCWAIISPDVDVQPNVFGEAGAPTGVREPEPGETVTKYGYRTGVTSGTVEQVSASVAVEYGFGIVVLENQIITDMVSDGGDSGAPVIVESTRDAAGTLFAGSEDRSVVNSIRNWESESGLKVVLSDGAECEVDADCPDGEECVGGKCQPKQDDGGGGDGDGGDRAMQAAAVTGLFGLAVVGGLLLGRSEDDE